MMTHHASLNCASVRRLHNLFDRADHVEGLLRQVVVLAVQNLAEAAHRIFNLDVADLRGP